MHGHQRFEQILTIDLGTSLLLIAPPKSQNINRKYSPFWLDKNSSPGNKCLEQASIVLPHQGRYNPRLISSGCRSWIINYNRHQILTGRINIRVLKDETDGSENGLPGRPWDPG